MQSMKDKLDALKEALYNSTENTVDSDFTRLIKIKDIDDELFETLILIHSNYKNEMQSVKRLNSNTITKLIDLQIDMLTHYKLVLADVDNLKNGSVKNQLLTPKNIVIVLTTLGIFISGIWVLFAINPAAGDAVVKVITSIFK